jgi:hypothetical protein
MDMITIVSGAVCALCLVLYLMRRRVRINREWE